MEFAANADPLFTHPTYIACVVLLPVNKIVSHLMDISAMSGAVNIKFKRTNIGTYHKYRLLLYYYVTKRYIEALTYCSPKKEDRIQQERDVVGSDLGVMKGVTQLLTNLPREFQRWNHYYKDKKRGTQIQPGGGNSPRKAGKAEKKGTGPPLPPRPFDITQRLHPSFQNALKKEEKTSHLQLHESWDPFEIAKRFHHGTVDIAVGDFFKEPCELYEYGQPKERSKKRTKEAEENEAEQKDGQDTDGSGSAKNPKRQNCETEKETQDEPVMTPDDVREVISKNLKEQQFTSRNLTTKMMDACNGIAHDIIEMITGNAPEGPLINKSDVIKE